MLGLGFHGSLRHRAWRCLRLRTSGRLRFRACGCFGILAWGCLVPPDLRALKCLEFRPFGILAFRFRVFRGKGFRVWSV